MNQTAASQKGQLIRGIGILGSALLVLNGMIGAGIFSLPYAVNRGGLLIGLFLPVYDFMYGLVAAIAIWILSGVVAKFWGVEKKK